MGSTQVLLCLFPGVFWLWHFLYSVGPHPVSSLHIYTFVVSRTFMPDATNQARDSSRAPGLTSGLQGSVNVHLGALLLVPQSQCISSIVFYTSIFGDLILSGFGKWLNSSFSWQEAQHKCIAYDLLERNCVWIIIEYENQKGKKFDSVL